MNNLANIYLKCDRSVEAEQLLLRAIEIKPTFAAAWMNVGLAQLAQKRYKVEILIFFSPISNKGKIRYGQLDSVVVKIILAFCIGKIKFLQNF